MDQDGWPEFLKLCAELQSSEDFRELFDLFLTIEEKRALSARYVIVQNLLRKKLTQREIAKTRNVSIAQITRGSNALKIVSQTFLEFLKKHMLS